MPYPRPAADDKSTKNDIPPMEWIAGALGLLIVAGTIGYLLFKATTDGGKPPDIRVEVVEVISLAEGFLAKFQAVNVGDETAANVEIEGTSGAGPDGETSQVTLGFLPPHSARRGGLFFQKDPRTPSLQLRAMGYEEP